MMYYETDREQEILKYLPLVEKVVNGLNIKRSDYERSDLINMGVIGLMDALNKFDHSKKVPFEGYAYIRIKGAIIDEVRKTSKVSRSRITKLNDFYKAKEKLEKTLMRTPSDHEICAELGIGEKELSKIHETVHQLASVSLEDVLFSEEGHDVEIQDVLEDTTAVNSEEALLEIERKEMLALAIKKLDEREQQILNMLYIEELSLKEIAFIYDLSIPRISQIHGKMIVKLKSHMKEAYND